MADQKTSQTEQKKENAIAVPEKRLSNEAMMSYIVDYADRVLTDNKDRSNSILDVVYYEEKEAICDSGTKEDPCVLINLSKLKDKEKIKAIYNIIHKIIENLKVDKTTRSQKPSEERSSSNNTKQNTKNE